MLSTTELQEICGSYVINYDQMWQTSICRLGNGERTDFVTSQGHTWIMTISQNPSRSPLVGLLPFVSPIPWQKYMKIIFFSKVHLEYRTLLSLQVISLKIILTPSKLISPKVFWRLPELNCEDAGRFSKPFEDYRRLSGKEFQRLPKASEDYSGSLKIFKDFFLNVKLQRFAKKNWHPITCSKTCSFANVVDWYRKNVWMKTISAFKIYDIAWSSCPSPLLGTGPYDIASTKILALMDTKRDCIQGYLEETWS